MEQGFRETVEGSRQGGKGVSLVVDGGKSHDSLYGGTMVKRDRNEEISCLLWRFIILYLRYCYLELRPSCLVSYPPSS